MSAIIRIRAVFPFLQQWSHCSWIIGCSWNVFLPSMALYRVAVSHVAGSLLGGLPKQAVFGLCLLWTNEDLAKKKKNDKETWICLLFHLGKDSALLTPKTSREITTRSDLWPATQAMWYDSSGDVFSSRALLSESRAWAPLTLPQRVCRQDQLHFLQEPEL